MKITSEQLEKLRVLSNMVLVKIRMFNDKIYFKDGTEILIDTAFEPQDHITATGEITKAPERLLFDRNKKTASMEWKTDMEVRPGDTVYMDYFDVLQALGMKANKAASYPMETWVEVEGDKENIYIFIPYASLFFAERDGRIIMLNGNIMAKHVKVSPKESLIKIVGEKKLKKYSWALVLESGSLIAEYMDSKVSDSFWLQEGYLIILKSIGIRQAERELHQTYRKGEKYFIIQRRWVFAFISEENRQEYIAKIEDGIV